MNMPLRLIASITCLMPLVCASAERLNIKTGLWEVTTVTQMEGIPLSRADLEKYTPQQRADIIAAAKKESAHPSRDTSKTCITEEDLREPFHGGMDKSCTQTIVRTTDTTQEVRMNCSGPRKATGSLKISTPTPQSMQGTMEMRTGEADDLFVIKGTMSGRWLSADCGDEAEDDAADEDDGPADDTEEEE